MVVRRRYSAWPVQVPARQAGGRAVALLREGAQVALEHPERPEDGISAHVKNFVKNRVAPFIPRQKIWKDFSSTLELLHAARVLVEAPVRLTFRPPRVALRPVGERVELHAQQSGATVCTLLTIGTYSFVLHVELNSCVSERRDRSGGE
eukprot:gene1477-biopygen12044